MEGARQPPTRALPALRLPPHPHTHTNAHAQVPVEMIEYDALQFGKLLGQGSGEGGVPPSAHWHGGAPWGGCPCTHPLVVVLPCMPPPPQPRAEGAVYAAWCQETPVAVKRTTSLMEVEMSVHAGQHDNVGASCVPAGVT